jgi:hypothetical protein
VFPYEEIDYLCAGIDHVAWYLRFDRKNQSVYPLIRAAMDKPEIYNEEIVRNEMFLHLDYYVTESSGHNSEYNAWFRKRPDLIEKYCTPMALAGTRPAMPTSSTNTCAAKPNGVPMPGRGLMAALNSSWIVVTNTPPISSMPWWAANHSASMAMCATRV